MTTTTGYHDAKAAGTIASFPPELAAYSAEILQLIDSVFSDAQIPLPENDRMTARQSAII
jgi:type III restriction enzyme